MHRLILSPAYTQFWIDGNIEGIRYKNNIMYLYLHILYLALYSCSVPNYLCAALPCRCDQYRWVHKGTYPVKHDGVVMKKKSSTIDIPNDNTGKGDNRFHRYEYWGIGSYFFMHYVGDCTISEGFCHRNSKDNTKPFIRSAPHVKGKVSEAN